MATHLTPDKGGASPFRSPARCSPWDSILADMTEGEASQVLLDLQDALDRESRGNSVLLEGSSLRGVCVFTAPSLEALEGSTLRPESFARIEVQDAASSFAGTSPSSPFPPSSLFWAQRELRARTYLLSVQRLRGRWTVDSGSPVARLTFLGSAFRPPLAHPLDI